MKSLTQLITEKLRISKPKSNHTLFPKTKYELLVMIESEVEKNGLECDLNHIDVSKIEDMSYIFNSSKFNGDISEWDVSNATRMDCMFTCSAFNGDISGWDVSSVKNMTYMFEYSNFNQDISNWDIKNVKYKMHIFNHCPIKEEYKPKFK